MANINILALCAQTIGESFGNWIHEELAEHVATMLQAREDEVGDVVGDDVEYRDELFFANPQEALLRWAELNQNDASQRLCAASSNYDRLDLAPDCLFISTIVRNDRTFYRFAGDVDDSRLQNTIEGFATLGDLKALFESLSEVVLEAA